MQSYHWNILSLFSWSLTWKCMELHNVAYCALEFGCVSIRKSDCWSKLASHFQSDSFDCVRQYKNEGNMEKLFPNFIDWVSLIFFSLSLFSKSIFIGVTFTTYSELQSSGSRPSVLLYCLWPYISRYLIFTSVFHSRVYYIFVTMNDKPIIIESDSDSNVSSS